MRTFNACKIGQIKEIDLPLVKQISMTNIGQTLKNSLRLLARPVIINAFLSFDESGAVIPSNWGDDLNYYFLKEIIKRPILLYAQSSLAFRLKLKNYLVIGSTVDMLCKKNTIVWGAGIIDGLKPLRMKPAKVCAVRGPLTREKLLQEGVECPAIYGDPAMLIARYFRPTVAKKYKLGIIHHVSEKPFELSGAKVISMSSYGDWREVIEQILECEVIASSSLHGLIIADSYGIPTVWTETKSLIGGHFKFHDYFASIGDDTKQPFIISPETKLDELIAAAKYRGADNFDLTPLIDAAPFAIDIQR
jgi:pyruvyltransferase